MEYKRGMDDPAMSDRKSLIPGPLRTFCTKTRAARTSYRRKRSLNFTGFIHLKERINENMTNEEGKSLQVSCLCTSYQRQYASTHEKEEKLIEILVKKKTFWYAALRFTSVVPWIQFLMGHKCIRADSTLSSFQR